MGSLDDARLNSRVSHRLFAISSGTWLYSAHPELLCVEGRHVEEALEVDRRVGPEVKGEHGRVIRPCDVLIELVVLSSGKISARQ